MKLTQSKVRQKEYSNTELYRPRSQFKSYNLYGTSSYKISFDSLSHTLIKADFTDSVWQFLNEAKFDATWNVMECFSV